MGHMNFKRIAYRVKEEFYATIEVGKVLGIGAAYATLLGKIDIQLIVHNGHIERTRYRRHLKKKHDVMNKYFSKVWPMTEKCENVNVPVKNKGYRDCIWICWWQGIENAPELVKKCVESIKKHAGNHKVIIITDENVREYVQFPSWIEEKYEKGIISKTHISDFLRLKLLAEYGGMWLDSTFYCIGSLEEYFLAPMWSIKRPNYRYTSVACGYFANYSFGCNYENRKIFAILAEYVSWYWKSHDYTIDYLFLDYLIVQVQEQNELVRKAFQQIVPNNPKCDELLKVMGLKFDEKLWEILKKDTVLFKLTWKKKYPILVNGEKTFYGKLISGELE